MLASETDCPTLVLTDSRRIRWIPYLRQLQRSQCAVIFYKAGSVSRKNSVKAQLTDWTIATKPENGHLSQRLFVSFNICTGLQQISFRNFFGFRNRWLPNTIDLRFFLNIGFAYSIEAGDFEGMIFVYHLPSMTLVSNMWYPTLFPVVMLSGIKLMQMVLFFWLSQLKLI